MQNELAEEARNYFKKHQILLKLAKAFCQKYRSLGHFGGSLALPAMPSLQQADLAAYLRRDAKPGDRLSYKDFAAAWEKTRFAGLPLEEFLLELMPDNFFSKQEERQREQSAREKIYAELAANYDTDPARKWLEALKSKELRLPQRDLYLRKELLGTIAQALASLPSACERLPFFANRVTSSPHGLDFDREAGRIFLQALAYLKGESVPREADERTSLMYEFHLLRDDILNFATIYGLTAYDETGRELAYWRAVAENCSPRFLYGGDCDPEGLGIANKLLYKYPKAHLWHMLAEEYAQAAQPLPEERLKKLPEELHPKLRPLAKAMREKKKILYQESLIEEMENDILK